MNNNFKIIESLIYLKGQEGLSVKELNDVLDNKTNESRSLLKEFKKYFNNLDLGFYVLNFDDVFYFVVKEEFKPLISKLIKLNKKTILSTSSLETIGIIAYKGPITRKEINDIRGVNSDGTIINLLNKDLIIESGVAKTPGNPILYEVNKSQFCKFFKINSLKDLPKINDNILDEQNNGLELDLFFSKNESGI